MLRDVVAGILVVLLTTAVLYWGAAYYDTKQAVRVCILLSCV